MFLNTVSSTKRIAIAFSVATISCNDYSADLDRAVAGEAAREIVAPAVEDRDVSWHGLQAGAEDLAALLPVPRSFCWAAEGLYVADGVRQRIEVFDSLGRHRFGFGRKGSGPGEFRRLAALSCSPDGSTVMAMDAANWRLAFFDSVGTLLDMRPAPRNPAGIPYPGEYALGSDGTVYDSWLGASVAAHLDDADWDTTATMRAWNSAGALISSFGRPIDFDDTVLRRVFNRPFLSIHHDTLWVLVQGPALIDAYSTYYHRRVKRVVLPVYHRGAEPYVETGPKEDGILRRNRAAYQPNVGSFDVLDDSSFVVVRYRNWRTVTIERRSGEAYTDYWPSSFIEVIDRDGRVVESVRAPGKLHDVATGPAQTLAVLSEDLDTGVFSVYLTFWRR